MPPHQNDAWIWSPSFRFSQESQSLIGSAPINDEHIAFMDLGRGQQSGNWIDHVPFNGSFQVARSVALISTFLQTQRKTLGTSRPGPARPDLAPQLFPAAHAQTGKPL